MTILAAVLQAEYEMDDEANAGVSLIDSSGNGNVAAAVGTSQFITLGFSNQGPNIGNSRGFVAGGTSGYSNTDLAGGPFTGSNYMKLECLVKLGALPASQLDCVALLDGSGNNVLTLSVKTNGHVIATSVDTSSASVVADSGVAVFPSTNWVHLVVYYDHATPAIQLWVSEDLSGNVEPAGYPPAKLATTGMANPLTSVDGIYVHPSGVALDSIDGVKFWTAGSPSALNIQPAPYTTEAGDVLVGTALALFPKGSAGVTAQLTLEALAVVNPDGTPVGYGLTDALNAENWSVMASDGTQPRIVEVVQSTSPGAPLDYWFDLTFEEPLNPGVTYTVWEENLTAQGNNSSLIADGSLVQSTFATFSALQFALPPPSFAKQVYGGDLSNPPFVGTFQLDSTGDLAIDSGLATLEKRIYRRLLSPLNGFAFLPGYAIGLLGKVKKLATVQQKRLLLNVINKQISDEPGVLSMDIQLVQQPNGVVQLIGTVNTVAGMLNLSYTSPRS